MSLKDADRKHGKAVKSTRPGLRGGRVVVFADDTTVIEVDEMETPVRTPMWDPPGTLTRPWATYFTWIQRTLLQIAGAGGGGGGGGGVSDFLGPVTDITGAAEVGTRYADDKDRLVHVTIGFVPVCPVPQSVTYLISADNGATWVWIGSQRMLAVGQQLKVDRLAPNHNSMWKVAAVGGNVGGDPKPILDANLGALYPGLLVRSTSFPVAGLATPPNAQGITATIGPQSDVIAADGFTHEARIPPVVYTDPVASIDFFVRCTVQALDSTLTGIALEKPYGGTQITGGAHTIEALVFGYVPGLAFMRFRFYTANRNSQGNGDFADPTTNTLQLVTYNGASTTANHYDVPVTLPDFVPIGPEEAFNVLTVTASEVGPKYQDENQALHTSIGVIPVIDADYTKPRTVTLWFDFGNGKIVWKRWHALTAVGQVIRLGDETLGTDGVRKAGDIWVPLNTAQGTWKVWCKAGRIDDGVDPTGSATATFTVIPIGPCIPNGTTDARFIPDAVTSDPIIYSKWDPGIWYWEYAELDWVPPTLISDPNYWFTLITVQKGATIGGVWTPAPDAEGVNDDPSGHWLGRAHVQVTQIRGLATSQTSQIQKRGARPATWTIPPLENIDLSPNLYREYRFLLYNVSRLGNDASGSGGSGTYTLQTSCWPGGTDHWILIPQPQAAALDIRAANPATIMLPLSGGNGQPLTVEPGSIGGAYLQDQSIHANHMAADSITAANQALAAGSVVDPKIVSVGINKVTYGTSVFAGDVVLSRGLNLPVIVLKNDGIYLYGQADASTGATGLTSKPYVAVQSGAIGLFHGGATGGSVFIDAVTSSITIYKQHANTGQPYFTVNSTGLSLVYGSNSMGITANALAFVDGVNGNRLDMSSAGISVSHGNNQLVILATALQLQYLGSARVTIDTTGIVLSNGGASSVTITAGAVSIVQGLLSLTSGTVTVNIDGTNYVKVSQSVGSTSCTINGSNFRVDGNSGRFATMTLQTLAIHDASSNEVDLSSTGMSFSVGGGSTQQVIGPRQTGPGAPSFSNFGAVETWCLNLLTALRTHGLVT